MIYAARVRRDQTREGRNMPYVTHLLAVAAIVGENGGTEDKVVTALLQDATEDQGGEGRLEDIRKGFGDEVAGIVAGNTDTFKNPKPHQRERKEANVARVAREPGPVWLVSAADRLHNARSVLAGLRSVGDETWRRFNGGKDGTLWYYRALVEAFETVGSNPVAEELDRVVGELGRLTGRRE